MSLWRSRITICASVTSYHKYNYELTYISGSRSPIIQDILIQDVILGLGSTFVFLDYAWFVFYYGLMRKVTAGDVPGVKKFIRIGCYFRAIQELFNTAVMFALVNLFSLRILLNNLGFSGYIIENMVLVVLAINNLSVPVLVVPLGKEQKINLPFILKKSIK